MKTRPGQPRGLALLLVIIVLAVASTLGMAMLSSGSLQANISSSAIKAAQADALAESGVQIAMYYLQNPTCAPAGFPAGSLTTSIGAGAPGTVTVSATPVPNQTSQYTVTAIASAGADATATIQRSVTAVVKVNQIYQFNAAAGFNSQITIPSGMTINGNGSAAYECNAAGGTPMVTQSIGSTVEGNVVIAASNSTAAPTAAQIASYASYTDVSGQSGTAQLLTPGSLSNTTLNSTSAANPDGVFIVNGNLTLKNTVTINGSLIVNGSLTLSSGATVKVNTNATACDGIPALVVTGTVTMGGPGTTKLTVQGLTWLGGNITVSGGGNSADNITITGAMLMDQGAIQSVYKGKINVTYNSTWAAAPNLAPPNTPVNLKIATWTPG
jgi:Tfp pilus assembly protein PilX